MTTAIIGSTGYLGKDIARRIAPREPLLLGYFSNDSAATRLRGELQALGHRVESAQVDIRDLRSVSDFLETAESLGDPLRAIISAEGAPFPVDTIAHCEPQDMAERLTTDVIGSLNILKAAFPVLARNGGGSIVLFSTAAVQRTLEYDAMSAVPKSAVAMLIRQAAREMGSANVRVNGVAPGVIETGKVSDPASLPPLVRSMVEDCMKHTPLGRTGTTAEVAALCEFLTSGDAAYISGQIVALDGGYSA